MSSFWISYDQVESKAYSVQSQKYSAYCQNLKPIHKHRALAYCLQTQPLNFATNDYLGLSKSQLLKNSVYKYVELYGLGSTGSRLVSGNREIYEQLEKQIAADHLTESALIFSSGFQLNSSVLPTLLDQKVLQEKPIVFCDKLNHASIYLGIQSAELVRYKHCDLDNLAELLQKYKNDTRPKFIVTETLYGMEGDVTDVKRISLLSEEHNAFLYLDEAHAIGMMGHRGYGIASAMPTIQYCIVGTFGKAIGAHGAYIACSEVVRDYLVNKCPGFIYSTALPPMLIGTVLEAWMELPKYQFVRENLLNTAEIFRSNLKKHSFKITNSASHITCILTESDADVLKCAAFLRKQNILVAAIRPPTVPSPRIRIAFTAEHTDEDIEKLLQLLVQFYEEPDKNSF